jgi:hypothetical protein
VIRRPREFVLGGFDPCQALGECGPVGIANGDVKEPRFLGGALGGVGCLPEFEQRRPPSTETDLVSSRLPSRPTTSR